MRWRIPLVAACAAVAWAQDAKPILYTAGAAIDDAFCEELVASLAPRVESYLRLRFRRRVMASVEPRGAWQKRARNDPAATARVAYVTRESAALTVVPWALPGAVGTNPRIRTRRAWRADIEAPVLELLARTLVLQNFPDADPGAPFDRKVARALLIRGAGGLAAHRTTRHIDLLRLYPRDQLERPEDILARYDREQAVGNILGGQGDVDGLDLLHGVSRRAGTRGVRALLYRPPPLALLVRPDVLGAIELDDPPEPDAILGFLAPGALRPEAVKLSLRPDEMFDLSARAVRGCLIGFVAALPDARYALYVADPDAPGVWADVQAKRLRALNPKGAVAMNAPMPLAGPTAAMLVVPARGGTYVRAELEGIVVLAFEKEHTPALVRRVLLALRALNIKRPRPGLYARALQGIGR